MCKYKCLVKSVYKFLIQALEDEEEAEFEKEDQEREKEVIVIRTTDMQDIWCVIIRQKGERVEY